MNDRTLLWGGLAIVGVGIGALIWKKIELDEPDPQPEPEPGPETSVVAIIPRDAVTEAYVANATVKIYSGGVYVGDAKAVMEGAAIAYERVLPIGQYEYTIQAPGYLPLEAAFQVYTEDLGKTKLLVGIRLYISPNWTAQLYWAGVEQIPFVVNGITYYGGWIKRALVPWDILLGETVQAPDAFTHEGRTLVFSSFWVSVYDRDHMETDWFDKIYENPARIAFPAYYARAGYSWRIQAKYDYV